MKVKDSWAVRKALMRPHHSRMELAVRIRLRNLGYAPSMDYSFTVKNWQDREVKTTPDFVFFREMWAFYLDGSVHLNKQYKDQVLRKNLARRHGFKVATVPYDGNSKSEVDKICKAIIGLVSEVKT